MIFPAGCSIEPIGGRDHKATLITMLPGGVEHRFVGTIDEIAARLARREETRDRTAAGPRWEDPKGTGVLPVFVIGIFVGTLVGFFVASLVFVLLS